jgi:hypothetical protein
VAAAAALIVAPMNAHAAEYISMRAITYYYDERAIRDVWGVHC